MTKVNVKPRMAHTVGTAKRSKIKQNNMPKMTHKKTSSDRLKCMFLGVQTLKPRDKIVVKNQIGKSWLINNQDHVASSQDFLKRII